MSYSAIDVQPLSGSIGAEILDVDLSKTLGNETFSQIHRAFLEYAVIFFRNQNLTAGRFTDFARRFGQLDPHHMLKGMDGHPEILEVLKEQTDRKMFAPGWHADVTWQEKPVMGAMLYAQEVPPYGGDTLFANQYLAYEALSPGMKKILDGLMAVHGTAKAYGDNADNAEAFVKILKGRSKGSGQGAEQPSRRSNSPGNGSEVAFRERTLHAAASGDDRRGEPSSPAIPLCSRRQTGVYMPIPMAK